MLTINQNANMGALITEKDENNNDANVMNVTVFLDLNNLNFNINCTVLNQTLLLANAADVQAQFNSLLDNIKQKMIDLQYPITIR